MEIEIRDFRFFTGPVKFSFDEGMNILGGPVGIGKTTILNAIAWCLYKQGRGINPYGAKSPSPQVSLTIEGEILRLKDSAKVTITRSSGNNHVIVRKGSEALEGELAQQFIDSVFGPEHIWRQIAYLTQGEVCSVILNRQGQERVRLLCQLIFTDREDPIESIKAVNQVLNRHHQNLNLTIARHHPRITELEQEISNRPRPEPNLDSPEKLKKQLEEFRAAEHALLREKGVNDEIRDQISGAETEDRKLRAGLIDLRNLPSPEYLQQQQSLNRGKTLLNSLIHYHEDWSVENISQFSSGDFDQPWEILAEEVEREIAEVNRLRPELEKLEQLGRIQDITMLERDLALRRQELSRVEGEISQEALTLDELTAEISRQQTLHRENSEIEEARSSLPDLKTAANGFNPQTEELPPWSYYENLNAKAEKTVKALREADFSGIPTQENINAYREKLVKELARRENHNKKLAILERLQSLSERENLLKSQGASMNHTEEGLNQRRNALQKIREVKPHTCPNCNETVYFIAADERLVSKATLNNFVPNEENIQRVERELDNYQRSLPLSNELRELTYQLRRVKEEFAPYATIDYGLGNQPLDLEDLGRKISLLKDLTQPMSYRRDAYQACENYQRAFSLANRELHPVEPNSAENLLLRKVKLETNLQQRKTLQADVDRLETHLTDLNALNNQRTNYQVRREKFDSLAAELLGKKKNLAKLLLQLPDPEIPSGEIPGKISEYQEAKLNNTRLEDLLEKNSKILADLRKRFDPQLDVRLGSLQANIAETEKLLLDLQEKIALRELYAEYDQIIQEINQIRHDMEIAAKVSEIATNLVKHKLDTSLTRLLQSVNEFLTEMFDEPVSMEISLDADSTAFSINFGLRLGNVLHDKLNGLSGGQKNAISLAFLLSFNRLYHTPLLLLDEILCYFDKSMRNRALKLIRKMSSENRMLTVVSMHDDVVIERKIAIESNP